MKVETRVGCVVFGECLEVEVEVGEAGMKYRGEWSERSLHY